MSAPLGPDRAEKYDEMMRLADLFATTGVDLRGRSRLGTKILAEPAVADSAELSPQTFERAEAEIRSATTGKAGLPTRSVELDADALVVRATVLTYRWIDELQEAAYQTLGSIAGRAIGYLAPQVALGGAIGSTGLIETDSLDRDDVVAYLNDLAENNPELMAHVASGGGLLESLQLRALLTAGAPGGNEAAASARGGLRAAGVAEFPADCFAALRDTAGALEPGEEPGVAHSESPAPRSLEDLMRRLRATEHSVTVEQVADGRFVVYLPGPHVGARPLRLVGGDHLPYSAEIVSAVESAVAGVARPHVLLVGGGPGGLAAAEVAAGAATYSFAVDYVVTAGAPAAAVPRIPEPTRALALEDRADPVAMLGSLVNSDVSNRLTVVFDASDRGEDPAYVIGGRAADRSPHPELRAELAHLRSLGYLA